MILYLFGGYSAGQNEEVQWRLIKKELGLLAPLQALYLGFTHSGQSGSFSFFLRDKLSSWLGEKFLDASQKTDLERAVKPLIFIDGGHDHLALCEAVFGNARLKDLILSASHVFGESAGAMFTGSKWRLGRDGSEAIDGLGFLKDTVIEVHYSQRKREGLLKKEMQDWGCQVGIGIDEACGIKIDTKLFPEKYGILGDSLVEIIKSPKA